MAQAVASPPSLRILGQLKQTLSQHSRGQHIRWRLSVILGELIVNKHLFTGSDEYRLTGQGNSNAEHANVIT